MLLKKKFQKFRDRLRRSRQELPISVQIIEFNIFAGYDLLQSRTTVCSLWYVIRIPQLCLINCMRTHDSAALETLKVHRSILILMASRSALILSLGVLMSASLMEGDNRPPATPSPTWRVLFGGLFMRHAFLMSISVVLTQPG